MCHPLKTRKPPTHAYNMSHFLDFPLNLHIESKEKKKENRVNYLLFPYYLKIEARNPVRMLNNWFGDHI